MTTSLSDDWYRLAGIYLHPLQPGAMRGDDSVGSKKHAPSSQTVETEEEIRMELNHLNEVQHAGG